MLTTAQLLFDKRNLETEYLKQWTGSGIDALIMPVTPWAGYLPKTWVSGPQYVGYTSIWNLLNYAALAVPATTVSLEEDRPDDDWLGHVPRNDLDEFNYRQCKLSDLRNPGALPAESLTRDRRCRPSEGSPCRHTGCRW